MEQQLDFLKEVIEKQIQLMEKKIDIGICILKVLSLLVLKIGNENENLIEVRDRELYIDEVLKLNVKKYFDIEEEFYKAEENIYNKSLERKRILLEGNNPDL